MYFIIQAQKWHFAFVKRKARLLFVIVKLYKSGTIFIRRMPCFSKKWKKSIRAKMKKNTKEFLKTEIL